MKRKNSRRKQENNPVIRSEYIIARLPPISARSLSIHANHRNTPNKLGIQNQQNAYRFDHAADSCPITRESFREIRKSSGRVLFLGFATRSRSYLLAPLAGVSPRLINYRFRAALRMLLLFVLSLVPPHRFCVRVSPEEVQ